MQNFQAKKYFDWGSLKFEPLQYFSASDADEYDNIIITKENSGEHILVSRGAFQNFQALGLFEKK